MSAAGEGGDITDVLFDGATFHATNQAISIKSMPMFVGRAINITYRNCVLHNVGTAVMMNMYGQNDAAGAGAGYHAHQQATAYNHATPASSKHAPLLLPSVRQILIQNVTGTTKAAGKFICGAGTLACSGIVMDRVVLALSAGGEALPPYQCQNANGSQSDCTPLPCSWN